MSAMTLTSRVTPSAPLSTPLSPKKLITVHLGDGSTVRLFRGFLDAIFPDLDDRLDGDALKVPVKSLDLWKLFQYQYERADVPDRDDLGSFVSYQELLRSTGMKYDQSAIDLLMGLPFTNARLDTSRSSGNMVALCAVGPHDKILLENCKRQPMSSAWQNLLGNPSAPRSIHSVMTLPIPGISLGTTASIDIPKQSDAVGWACLNLVLPALPSPHTWCTDVCSRVISNVQLQVGGNIIKCLDGTSNAAVAKSFGIWPKSINCYGKLNPEKKIMASRKPMYIKIPLCWQLPHQPSDDRPVSSGDLWGLGLATVSLQWHGIKLRIHTRNIESLTNTSVLSQSLEDAAQHFTMSVDTEQIYLDMQCRSEVARGTQGRAEDGRPTRVTSDDPFRPPEQFLEVPDTDPATEQKSPVDPSWEFTEVDGEESQRYCKPVKTISSAPEPLLHHTTPNALPFEKPHGVEHTPSIEGTQIIQNNQTALPFTPSRTLNSQKLTFNHPCTGFVLTARADGTSSLSEPQQLPFDSVELHINNMSFAHWRVSDASDFYWRLCGKKPPHLDGVVSLLLPFSADMFNAADAFPVTLNFSRMDNVELRFVYDEQPDCGTEMAVETTTTAVNLNVGVCRGGMYGIMFSN